MMTEREFDERLNRLGPDVEAWPAPDRRAAMALLDESPVAVALWRQALHLERALTDSRARASDALRQRVLTLPLDHSRPAQAGRGWFGGWLGGIMPVPTLGPGGQAWGGSLASGIAAALLGITLGYGGLVPSPLGSTAVLSPADELTLLVASITDLPLLDLTSGVGGGVP